MRIGLLGTPHTSGNRGVQALGASLVALSVQAAPGILPKLFLGSRTGGEQRFRFRGGSLSIPICNFRLSPRSYWREHLLSIVLGGLGYRYLPVAAVRRRLMTGVPWIAGLEESEWAGDIRGGDSFSDIYGMRRFIEGFLVAWTVILVKGSIVQFPQTFGPYRSRVSRILARYLLRRSSVIIARDRESRRVAQELVWSGKEVWLSPDVAFSLEAIQPAEVQLDPPGEASLSSRTIGLNVNGLMYHGGYTRRNQFGLELNYAELLPRLITSLLEEHPGELWLVPHTWGPPESVESDPEACRKVRASLPDTLQGRVRIVTGEYDCHEIKSIIGGFDFFIGSRMHACIAALSQGVPCAGIAYSRKFLGVFETVGMETWVVDGRSVGDDEAVHCVLELYRRRNEVRAGLVERADAARRELDEVFRRLFEVAGLTGGEQDGES